MKDIVNNIHKVLIKNKKTIAVAESCSGGMLSSSLTRYPGSSQYFILGVVVYNNRVKENLLKISSSIIVKNGAVSYIVAKDMARNIRKIAKTDYGIGITGIAGPTGGRQALPKGTVFISVSSKKKQLCKKFFFRGSRLMVKKMSVIKALELLKRII